MKIQPNSNISFTSKIKILCGNELDYSLIRKLKAQGNYVDSPYDKGTIISAPSAYTDNICNCTAGGILSNNKITMFHLIPWANNIKHFDKVAEVLLNKIGDTKKNLTGFIVGGWSSKEYPKSRELFEKIFEFFDKKNIKHSMFWGQNCSATNLLYSAAEDTLYISPIELIDSPYSLKRAYEKIKLAPHDQLFINDELIKNFKNTEF